MKTGDTEAPALIFLRAAGVTARRLEYAYHEGGGTGDAAAQLGLPEHHIVKSLVFDDGAPSSGRGVMVLMPGDERVSLRKLERLSGIHRLFPSSPADAERLTGYRPGGICPFGLREPLPIYMEEDLLRLDELYINAGLRGVIAAVSPRALRLVNPTPGDLRSAGDKNRERRP